MAIQYFRVAVGKFIQYDDETGRAIIILRTDLQTEKQELQNRIGAPDPNIPKTNAEWIAWGKARYSYIDHSVEQARLDEVNAILTAIKDL